MMSIYMGILSAQENGNKEIWFNELISSLHHLHLLNLLNEELIHLEEVFVMKNNFPIWIVYKILTEEK